MQEKTSEWLAPMIEASEQHVAPERVRELMTEASFPAREADTPLHDWLAKMPIGSSQAIDWVRFGQLLRTELAWDHYPETPGE